MRLRPSSSHTKPARAGGGARSTVQAANAVVKGPTHRRSPFIGLPPRFRARTVNCPGALLVGLGRRNDQRQAKSDRAAPRPTARKQGGRAEWGEWAAFLAGALERRQVDYSHHFASSRET